ncbi:MAG: DUF1573 domain-containing protein [Bacteroidales bacterium]
MRKLTFYYSVLLVLVVALASCNSGGQQSDREVSTDLINNPVTASGKGKTGDLPVMTFENTRYDFGIVIQGEKVEHTFTFTNTGGSDLVISQASSTCGCTVGNFSKEPIRPGEKGTVDVMFNSAGRSGAESKSVSLLTNAQPNTVKLEITAEVMIPGNKK